MSEYNNAILTSLIGAMDRFDRGEIGLAEIQTRLESAVDLLERQPGGVREAIRLAEADLEEIQFVRLLDEQRPAAAFRLDELRSVLAAELRDED